MRNIESRLRKIEVDLKPTDLMAVFSVNYYSGEPDSVINERMEMLKKEYLEAGNPPFSTLIVIRKLLRDHEQGIGKFCYSLLN